MTDHEKYPDWEELACNDPDCFICTYNPNVSWHGNTPPAPMAVKISRFNWPMIAVLLLSLAIWALIIFSAVKAVRS